MPEQHAMLSASGSSRWLVCTPSASLEALEPATTSVFAEEGTKAHTEAEKIFREAIARMDIGLASKANTVYEIGPYIDYVVSLYRELSSANPDAVVLLVEQKVDFSDYVPGGFGTIDAVIISNGCLEIIDLKYGKGIAVSAYQNTQMRLYALGALKVFGAFYDNIERIKMTIVQPRLDSISTDEMSVSELIEWAENVVKPTAALASKGEGVFIPGAHCRFCKIAGKCRARLLNANAITPFRANTPATLAPTELGEILPKIDELESWAKAIKEHALDLAIGGTEIPGYKLVEGRSLRKYTDTVKVAAKLTQAGYAEAVIYNRELLGISAMEKLLGKKQFTALLGELVEKSAGKPTLAPLTDKRESLKGITAAQDYSDLYQDTEDK